jgi:hypothetical protein
MPQILPRKRRRACNRSWRATRYRLFEGQPVARYSLFEGRDTAARYAEDKWITLGGSPKEGEGKHHGGFPALVNGDGTIVAGGPKELRGRNVKDVHAIFEGKRKGGEKSPEKDLTPVATSNIVEGRGEQPKPSTPEPKVETATAEVTRTDAAAKIAEAIAASGYCGNCRSRRGRRMTAKRSDNPKAVTHRLSETARRLLTELAAVLSVRDGHTTETDVLEKAVRALAKREKVK